MDYNAQYWKSKSVTRNAENKELKKRIKEIKIGREKWKVKYKLKSEEVLKYKKEINAIKKDRKNTHDVKKEIRPKNYKYPLSLIQFFIAAKLTTSTSFRALEKLVVSINIYLNLELGQPSYGTILIWMKKVGLYSLQQPIEKSDDWILIIDESIAVGHERLLVIYGIQTSSIDFQRALTYKDLTPLFIKSSNKWTGDIIKKEIDTLIENIGNVKYIVADGGNGICRSIRLLKKIHVYDITHKMALLLKNIYSKDEAFIKYTKNMTQMRAKGVCSDISHIIPPKQRTNSRFMNLDILSDWGLKALNCLEANQKNSKIYTKLE
ncbi:MAG: hypothetical protein GY714_11055, partial [Desulfobacterales bacterium]|nr:hypothetical protein [Desulfobacterales bacterium]